jgi:hypothetical protein
MALCEEASMRLQSRDASMTIYSVIGLSAAAPPATNAVTMMLMGRPRRAIARNEVCPSLELSSGTATEKENQAAFPTVSCQVVRLRWMTSLRVCW